MPMPGGMSAVGVGINFSAQDLASGPIGILSRNFGSLQQQMSKGAIRIGAGFAAITAGATAMAAGTGMIRGAWDLSQTAAGFERAMAGVRTISRATTQEFEALEQAAVQAGIATQFSPEEAAGGLRMLAQQGLDANNAITALVPTLDFASAGQVAVADAAEIGMGVLNAYGMQVEQLPVVYDRLMRATQMSALGADEFLVTMGRAASSGALFGQQLDEVMVALASVRSQGIPATVATTAVGEAFRRLGAEQETQRIIQSKGVDVIDRATGKFRPFTTVMREFGQAISHLSEAEQARLVNQAFHVRGMRTFHAMANMSASVMEDGTRRTLRGAEAHAYYRRQLEESGGTTEEFRERDLATLGGAMILLEGTVQTLGTVIGQVFGEIFNPMVRLVTDTLNRFIVIWRGIPEPLQKIIGVVTLLTGVFSVIGGAIMAVVGVAAILITVMGEILLVATIASAGIMAALIPIGLMFAGLIGIGYALYQAYEQNLGGLRDFVNEVARSIDLAWRGVMSILSGEGVRGAIRGEMIAAGGEMLPFMDALENIYNNVMSVWDGVKTGFSEAWSTMGPVIGELKTAFGELWVTIRGLFAEFLGGANNMPQEQFQSLGQTIGQVLVGAIRTAVNFVIGLVRVFRFLIVTVRSLKPVFMIIIGVFRVWAAIARVVRTIIGFLVKVVWNLAKALFWVQKNISLGYWLGRAFRGVVERDDQTAGARLERSNERRERRQEGQERTQSAMERPAVAAQQGREGGGGGAQIADAIREGNRRRTPVEMNFDINLDGNVMQSITQQTEIDGQSIDGGMPVSEWVDF